MSQVILDFHRGSTFTPSREGWYLSWYENDPGKIMTGIAQWDNRHWFVNGQRVKEVLFWARIPAYEKLVAIDHATGGHHANGSHSLGLYGNPPPGNTGPLDEGGSPRGLKENRVTD